MKSLCVYCSSSDAVAPEFLAAAEELGAAMAHARYTLVYGGGNVGLMGVLARTVQGAGGKVIGVIPKVIHDLGFAHAACDELIVTDTMRERKEIMDRRADAFIALPGGFGTLDEILEIVSLKQLNYHNRPIVFLNTQAFFTPLLQVFEHLVHARFAKASSHQLYHAAPTVTDALHFINNYQPPPVEQKWP